MAPILQITSIVLFLISHIAHNAAMPGKQKTQQQYYQLNPTRNTYHYGYEVGPNGHFHHERRGQDGVTYGCYGHIDPNGKLQVTHYVSDLRGYRVVQPNAPVEIFISSPARNGVQDDASEDYDYDSEDSSRAEVRAWQALFLPKGCGKYAIQPSTEGPELVFRPPGAVSTTVKPDAVSTSTVKPATQPAGGGGISTSFPPSATPSIFPVTTAIPPSSATVAVTTGRPPLYTTRIPPVTMTTTVASTTELPLASTTRIPPVTTVIPPSSATVTVTTGRPPPYTTRIPPVTMTTAVISTTDLPPALTTKIPPITTVIPPTSATMTVTTGRPTPYTTRIPPVTMTSTVVSITDLPPASTTKLPPVTTAVPPSSATVTVTTSRPPPYTTRIPPVTVTTTVVPTTGFPPASSTRIPPVTTVIPPMTTVKVTAGPAFPSTTRMPPTTTAPLETTTLPWTTTQRTTVKPTFGIHLNLTIGNGRPPMRPGGGGGGSSGGFGDSPSPLNETTPMPTTSRPSQMASTDCPTPSVYYFVRYPHPAPPGVPVIPCPKCNSQKGYLGLAPVIFIPSEYAEQMGMAAIGRSSVADTPLQTIVKYEDGTLMMRDLYDHQGEPMLLKHAKDLRTIVNGGSFVSQPYDDEEWEDY